MCPWQLWKNVQSINQEVKNNFITHCFCKVKAMLSIITKLHGDRNFRFFSYTLGNSAASQEHLDRFNQTNSSCVILLHVYIFSSQTIINTAHMPQLLYKSFYFYFFVIHMYRS